MTLLPCVIFSKAFCLSHRQWGQEIHVPWDSLGAKPCTWPVLTGLSHLHTILREIGGAAATQPGPGRALGTGVIGDRLRLPSSALYGGGRHPSRAAGRVPAADPPSLLGSVSPLQPPAWLC